MVRRVITYIRYSVLITLIVLCLVGIVQAATGNIDSTDKWAWGTNVGWINFRPEHGGVTVYSDHLEGYAWGENIGWIRLGSDGGGGTPYYANTTKDNYGVNNDAVGNLSGYAWGTNVGWINFNPSDSQVTIDPVTGSFDGYAWGENVGWIHFKGTEAVAYNVVTSYHPTDLGDAPDPDYPTLLVSTGASHVLGSGVYLGDCVDLEADGQPSAASTDDDTNIGAPVFGTCVGDDDEDGVTFTTPLRIGKTADIEVVANTACKLSAWIDFNGKDAWSDADEEIFSGQDLAAGVNNLSFAVPPDAVAGMTHARFRCTTDGAVTFSGQASDGEVEDYQVRIACVADLDGNGKVNAADLSSLLSQWGECAGCLADLNGNGWVNLPDLSILVSQWGDCP